MENNRLISMVEKVLSTYNGKNLVLNGIKYNEILKYANFINQPLNIGQFTPAEFVDGKWIVLVEPKNFKIWFKDMVLTCDMDSTIWYGECERYKTALDNVMFEGCVYDKSVEAIFAPMNGNSNDMIGVYLKGTIQDLVKYNLTLTPNGLTKSGLK